MTESDLSEVLFQLSVVKSEKENYERANVGLISQVTKLEKRVTELLATLRTELMERDGLKGRCEQYQRAYQELSQRLGTYDTNLIAKLEDKARKAECEVRRLRAEFSRQTPRLPSPAESPRSRSGIEVEKREIEAEKTCERLKSELDKSKKQIEMLVDQLTTEIEKSAKTQEEFLSLKERYHALYRENREDAVCYPIPAPDPQDTPRLPYSRPSFIASQGKVATHRRLCSRCGQPLADSSYSPAK